MFLSRIVVNAVHPRARIDLADRYELHRTLARAFADSPDSAPDRFLWRLERGVAATLAPELLVQSVVPGRWGWLEGSKGYAVDVQGNKPFDLESWVRHGGNYRFRLFANPTVTRQGKRLGLAREEDQLAWLGAQASKSGFEILTCQRSGVERIQARQGKSGNRITLQGAQFDGLLSAIDPERLRNAVAFGLGHGKVLGLGLLSLARVR